MVLVLVNIGAQEIDGEVINIAGRQRMLSQNISKHAVMVLSEEVSASYPVEGLEKLANDFLNAHAFLDSINTAKYQDQTIDSLLRESLPHVEEIGASCQSIVSTSAHNDRVNGVIRISNAEQVFLPIMEQLVESFETIASQKVSSSQNILIALTILTLLVLVVEFVFFMVPFFDQLVSKNDELKALNNQLRDFVQIITHNLRAPVSNLVTLNEFIKVAETQEEKDDVVSKFSGVIEGLTSTMDVLMEILISGTPTSPKKEVVQLQKVFDKTMDQLSGNILAAGATFKADFEVTQIKVQPVYIDSIFLNLLSNSLKYRDEGRKLEVEVASRRQGASIVLSFKDNGSGLDLDRYGEKLFGIGQIFHKDKNSKGYGLFLTKGHIKSLGGEIRAEVNESQGLTFIVTLPDLDK